MGNYKLIELTIEQIFEANFTDSYLLEKIYLDLNDLLKDELVWIDPYNGKSKINDTLIAVKYDSNEGYILLKKMNDNIIKLKSENDYYLLTEEYDKYKNILLVSHISFR